MGSTGNASLGKRGNADTDTSNYGIKGVVAYKGAVPENSGLEKPSSNNITLKSGNDKSSILFQFKLTSDQKFMNISAYKNGKPEVKVKVKVDSTNPSINQLLKSTSATERNNAVKMKDLMNKSTEVSESQLGSIADNLKKRREMNRG